MEEVHKKKINWHNEVHTYWRQFWCHIWWSLKTLKMSIEIIFGQFCWPSYLTSKLTSISVNLIMSIYFFFVNLLHSLHVWLFDIWHLFDNFTSFQYFDISIKLKPPQPAQGYFHFNCCTGLIYLYWRDPWIAYNNCAKNVNDTLGEMGISWIKAVCQIEHRVMVVAWIRI